jgi:hypothetical protein
MTTAKEYRDYAAECMEWAKTATTDADREIFLQMAASWLKAASLAEPMTIRAEPSKPIISGREAP